MARNVARLVVLLGLLLGLSPRAARVAAQPATPMATPTVGVLQPVATNLVNPRGFVWAADGTLYVAQAGNGGPTPGAPPLPPPVGPNVGGGPSASVVRIVDGCPVLVAGGLPSVLDSLGEVLGAEDLAILGDHLYVAVDGGGPAHGNPTQPAGVYRVLANGQTELVADLSAWTRAHPVAHRPPDFDPDAAGFSLVADDAAGRLWVVNPNSEELLSVTPNGAIARIADLSSPTWHGPTGLALDPKGGVYVGTLTPAPFPDGTAKVMHVAPDGTTTDVWTGLTAVTDVAVGAGGTLYAAELSTGNLSQPPFLVPGSGRIVRQTGPGSSADVATGLLFPIALRVGPDGALYVAMPAVGADHGGGMIARLEPSGATAATPAPQCPAVGGATPVSATPYNPLTANKTAA
jgi:sugar lactone lactonase YvrE